MKRAAIVFDEGFEEVEALAPVDMLRRGGVQVDMVCNQNAESVSGRSGVKIDNLIPFDQYDFSQADALILPGGTHFKKLEANEALKEQIAAFDADENKILAAICASPTILGRMGLLRDREYVCFVPMNEDFGGESTPDALVVVDDKLITGRSAAAAIEFGLTLLEELAGEEARKEVEKGIIYE